MPHIHAHPLEVVAASIATESKPPQTIVAGISIIGETTAPRLRRSSHISPLTMLVSFVCGWNSMPASAADDAPGRGQGQGFPHKNIFHPARRNIRPTPSAPRKARQ